jgi:uridine kinase
MLVIGIAGGSGSGKTTIAHAIKTRFGLEHVILIPQDSYYLDRSDLTLEEREKINYDHPDSFENELLYSHLSDLKRGIAVEMPTYDFTIHARSPKKTLLSPKPVVIVEGILILADPKLRSIMDMKVFVDTDPDERVLRRALRDTTMRGRTLESVERQYLATVKPMHETFIEPSKKFADIIIPEGGHNETAVDLLVTWIAQHLTLTAAIASN